MINFAHPELLWALALLPLIAFLKGKKGKGGAVRFPTVATAKAIAGSKRVRAGSILGSLRFLALAFFIVALARPQLGKALTEVDASGIDILLVVDTSSSMRALDFELKGKPADRLAVVKSVVAEFIKERPNDRIGLVAFAAKGYAMSPLTLDHNWLQKRLDDFQIGMIEDGTAIGSAVAAATNRLREQEAKSRIMIVLTDGVNNRGGVSPETAAEAAHALGIKIYTIGAGTNGEAPHPVQDMFGRMRTQMVPVEIDEEKLQTVAQLTGGKYYRATDTDSLKDIYDEINALETTKRTIHKFENYDELFHWLVLVAVALILLELLLRNTRFKRLP